MIYRQGDILLCKINKPKLNKVRPLDCPVILGHGEVTGHLHQIKKGARLHAASIEDAQTFALIGGDMPIFLEVTDTTEIVHEEHGPISLSPGWYKPVRQREYEPKGLKYVAD